VVKGIGLSSRCKSPPTAERARRPRPRFRRVLVFLPQHAGKTVVVKYGGHAMSDENAAALFARDIVLLQRVGVRVVIVHGGGPQVRARTIWRSRRRARPSRPSRPLGTTHTPNDDLF
jgi:acetylglutamate kinase